MKKKLLYGICAVIFAMFSINVFAGVFPVSVQPVVANACGVVPSYKDPNFCNEFKSVVICNCDVHFPARLQPIECASVTEVYHEMIGFYGTITKACINEYGAHDAKDIMECRNQWHCAVTGRNAENGACPGNLPAPNKPCGNIG